MKSLFHRLQADKMLLQQYSDVIRSQLEAGIIELVNEQTAMGNTKLVNAQSITDSNRLHYLPHHPVNSFKMTTRIRIVYDPSVRAKKGIKALMNVCTEDPSLYQICVVF